MTNNFQKFKKVPLFISIIFLLLSFSVFLILYMQIQNNNKKSEQAEIAWQDEANRRNEMKALDRSLKIIEEEKALLETHFLKSSDVVSLLDMVEKLASEAGAKAEVSLVDLLKDNAGLVVEMKASGRFEAVYKFLTLLENSPYELNFILIDMQKLGEEAGSDKKAAVSLWSATFRVRLLSFIP